MQAIVVRILQLRSELLGICLHEVCPLPRVARGWQADCVLGACPGEVVALLPDVLILGSWSEASDEAASCQLSEAIPWFCFGCCAASGVAGPAGKKRALLDFEV